MYTASTEYGHTMNMSDLDFQGHPLMNGETLVTVRSLESRHQDTSGIMYTTKYKGGHINVTLTFTFTVISQGEVNYFGELVIPDVEKVRIDTKIKSVSCNTSKAEKCHKK